MNIKLIFKWDYIYVEQKGKLKLLKLYVYNLNYTNDFFFYG